MDIPAWLPHASGRFWPGFEGLSPEEHDAKLFEVATQYYKTITEAIRRYDPNHLILGDRYNGNKGIPEVVLRAMAPFVDVLSVQYFTGKTEEEYTAMISDLRQWHEITGKPVVIADIGNWVPTCVVSGDVSVFSWGWGFKIFQDLCPLVIGKNSFDVPGHLSENL